MSYKPGDNYTKLFDTYSVDDGSSSDADSPPTAALYRNGVLDVAVTVTISNVGGAEGLYKASLSIPESYVTGDSLEVRAVATSDGVEAGAVIATIQLEGLGGPSAVTLTFTDEDDAVVPYVRFSIIGRADSRANVSGVSTFGLADGSYSVVGEITDGVVFPITTLVVSGTTALTIQGQGQTIAAPALAGECAVEWTSYGSSGATPKNGVTYSARYTAGPNGTSMDGKPFAITSSGTAALNTRKVFLRGWTVTIYRGTGQEHSFLVPDRSTAFLDDTDVLGLSAAIIGTDA